MLLRAAFAALCLAPSASAFSLAPSFHGAPSLPSRPPSRLHVGIHEQAQVVVSEDELLREKKYVAVLQEVDAAKMYLDWLIHEQNGGDAAAATLGEALAAAKPGDSVGDAAADAAPAEAEVELFGGGGGGDSAAPAENFPSETAYRAALRPDLGAAVLLTGPAVPDAALLALLNNNLFGQAPVPNFAFATIRALVTDAKAAKKGAIGREARYSGLLDKLSIEDATGALPSAEELRGATSWIAEVAAGEAATALPKIAQLAAGSEELKHLAVLVTGVHGDAVEGWDAVVAAAAGGSFRPTLLAAGALHAEAGGFVHVGALGADPAAGVPAAAGARALPRGRAYQLLALGLALESTAGAALAAYELPEGVAAAAAAPYAEGAFAEYAAAEGEEEGTEAREAGTFDAAATRGEALEDALRDVKLEGRLVRALRETGLTPLMELDVLAGGGVASFKEYIANPPEPESETEWTKKKTKQDEEDERIMAVIDANIAKDAAAKEAKLHKNKEVEVAGIAQEWAIKEYALRSLSGALDRAVTEADFIASSGAEARAEAEATYARIKSPEFRKAQEATDRANGVSHESQLFFEGLNARERKKREMIVARVKKQYEDMLSEEEMEQIILSEI